jgi:hypothetical protein
MMREVYKFRGRYLHINSKFQIVSNLYTYIHIYIHRHTQNKVIAAGNFYCKRMEIRTKGAINSKVLSKFDFYYFLRLLEVKLVSEVASICVTIMSALTFEPNRTCRRVRVNITFQRHSNALS